MKFTVPSIISMPFVCIKTRSSIRDGILIIIMKEHMKTKFNVKQNSLKFALVSAFALGSAVLGVNSQAATSTGTFSVGGTVTASCTVSGSPLTFGGTINALGGNVDATSTLTATCTNGSAYTIGLNAGASTNITAGATTSARKLLHSNGTNTLNYSLSTVASGGTNWDDIGGTTVASGTGNGAGQSITVYGRIPTGQTGAIVGAYSDTITATIDF